MAAIAHLFSIIRDRETEYPEFSMRLSVLGSMVIASALEHAPFKNLTVQTPLEPVAVKRILEKDIVGIPILRAGLGMVKPFQSLLPNASVYHIGLKRDEETLEPDYYYDSLPKDLTGRTIFLLDPMLATGGSAVAAAELVSKRNPAAIVFCGIIGAPEGVKMLNTKFPEIPIYLGALDDHLDVTGYIRPGLGDAGDRLFGT
jgi:uracil phosphoribosyltransferase